MTLIEALRNAEKQNKFCIIKKLGCSANVNLDEEDIDIYVVYDTERCIQKYTDVWYYDLYVILDKPNCKIFVDTLKTNQSGFINGITIDGIIKLMDNYTLSEIKFIIISCIKHGLLEKQGDLYIW